MNDLLKRAKAWLANHDNPNVAIYHTKNTREIMSELVAALQPVDDAEVKRGKQLAIRQYLHNDGSGLVFGYDKETIDVLINRLYRQNREQQAEAASITMEQTDLIKQAHKVIDRIAENLKYIAETITDSKKLNQQGDLTRRARLAKAMATAADNEKKRGDQLAQHNREQRADIERLRGELEAATKVLEEVEQAKRDAVHRTKTIWDPSVDPMVKALCEKYGYGAVMDSASRQWIKKDSVGAFYIGGCLALESIGVK